MNQVIRTIDAHVGGEPLRLIVEGAPHLAGRTMRQKQEAMRRHGDHLRRAIVLEPRGHADMRAAVLTEPVAPGSDAGLLFMDGDGFTPLSGHGVGGVGGGGG
jgi:proline racemase